MIQKKSMMTALVMACTACMCAKATVIEDDAAEAKKDANRFVIHDKAIAVHRPDETWTFKADESDPPVIATITSADAAADVSIQAQVVPGIALQDVKQMVEDALKAQVDVFTKHSGTDREINGVQAYELVCSMTKDGTVRKARLVLFKPGAALYIVKCVTSPEHWERFEKQFDAIVSGFGILDAQEQDVKDEAAGA